jgi:peptidoglycan/LPS O-acetylase OafA/YrhL
VRVFFVISGFLITSLILEEKEETGGFSLARFYARRAWRILPAACTLLLCLLIANLLHLISIPVLDYVRALTYTMNYGPVPNWYVGHLWSLSVEEQFYFLWPFLLAFLPLARCRYIAIAFILVSVGLRYYMTIRSPENLWRIEYQFQYSGTALAFGCLLAIDRTRLWAQSWFRALCSSPFTAPVACVLLFANSLLLRTSGAAGLCAADIITNLGILTLVAKFTCWPVGPIARVLNAAPVAFVGTISYSLYLWQQPFTAAGMHTWITRFPYNLALIFLCALGSYYLVERPTLKMRKALHSKNRAQSLAVRAAPVP